MHEPESPVLPGLKPQPGWGGGQQVCLIGRRSRAAVGPGTIAGKDHREGAAGHRDPLDIVLLPADMRRKEGRSKGGHGEKSGARLRPASPAGMIGKRKRAEDDSKHAQECLKTAEKCRQSIWPRFSAGFDYSVGKLTPD